MAKSFHDQGFTQETQLKLELFRKYIRKWLPVFLTKPEAGAIRQDRPVHIFDFFSGPGTDGKGVSGSPLLVMEEVLAFCQENQALRVARPHVEFHFSDDSAEHVQMLRQNVAKNLCSVGCCRATVIKMSFVEALEQAMPTLQDKDCACLVIMDQFGLKEVTPETVIRLSRCPVTDILFFVSSSFIHRFAEEEAVQKYFDVSAERLRQSDYRSIHRYVCDYYRSKLPEATNYHLVPFSIKKGSNIYGIVFGSGNVLGLYKAVQTCWELDGVTGEANYSVDGDITWSGQQALFDDFNVPRKRDLFRKSLEQMIQERTAESPLKGANNREVFLFTLESGFLPKHAKEELRKLENDKRIEVVAMSSEKLRKGAYYVSWDEYRDPQKGYRCAFRYIGENNESQ